MSFFKPKIPLKPKEIEQHHPWEKSIKDIYSQRYKYCHNSANNPTYEKKSEEEVEERIQVILVGNRVTKEFIYCSYLLKGLYKYKSKVFDAPIIRGLTSVEWPLVWNDLKIQYGSKVYCLRAEVAVIVNGKFLGGADELKEFVESKYKYNLCINYYHESIQQMAKFIRSCGRPCVYLHFSVDDKEIGSMIFMLYADMVPRTCENFLRLCSQTKGGYPGTPVHRIVKDCWIQCGGYGLKDSPDLGCENFNVPHDRRGVLCMANDSRHVDCSTQFFVLLQPAPWMQHKYVAFGQLIEGDKTLTKIENVPEWYESPTKEIIICKAGVFNMECQYRPINKNTHEYINQHIENLVEFENWLYQEIFDRAFAKIEANIRKYQQLEEESMSTSSSPYSSTPVKSADEYHCEDEYTKVTAPGSVAIKPDKPYYIPLTDVPYPNEIDSVYDFKKMLRGNYCYENDLCQDDVRNISVGESMRRLSIPEALVSTLFECFTFGDSDDEGSSRSSLASSEQNLIQQYLNDNMDSTSFGGHVIKQIAQLDKKYEVFDNKNKNEAMERLHSDDELRIIRMAIKEYKSKREKKVSICLNSSRLSHGKIIRRQTGYIRKEDLASLRVDSDTFEPLEEEIDETTERKRYTDSFIDRGRQEMQYHDQPPRASVLLRLYEDLSKEIADVPIFKDLKSPSAAADKSFVILRQPSILRPDDEPDWRFERLPDSSESINHALQLQHGARIYRKLSSDYVRTIDHLEHKTDRTLRTIEYAKKRPWLSVSQYKMKNKMYRETLNAPPKNDPIP